MWSRQGAGSNPSPQLFQLSIVGIFFSTLKMSKSKQRKATQRARPKHSLEPSRSNQPNRIWRAAKILLGAFATIATLSGGYAGLHPRILIEPPSEVVDSSHPDTSAFTFVNDRYFSIYNMHLTCTPGFDVAALPVGSGVHTRFVLKGLSAVKLEAGERRSFVCNIFREPREQNPLLVREYIYMEVRFRVFRIVPWWSEHFVFRTGLEEDGKLRWSSPPLI